MLPFLQWTASVESGDQESAGSDGLKNSNGHTSSLQSPKFKRSYGGGSKDLIMSEVCMSLRASVQDTHSFNVPSWHSAHYKHSGFKLGCNNNGRNGRRVEGRKADSPAGGGSGTCQVAQTPSPIFRFGQLRLASAIQYPVSSAPDALFARCHWAFCLPFCHCAGVALSPLSGRSGAKLVQA